MHAADRNERGEKREGASRASLVFAFAAGAAAAALFLEVYGVSRLSPAGSTDRALTRAEDASAGPGTLLEGVRKAADKFAIYARSFVSEAKTKDESSGAPPQYRTLGGNWADGNSVPFVPDPVRSPVLAKASLIGKLPSLSGVPAAEVFEACAKNVDRALAARLVWDLSRGEAWSVGEVGGDVIASSTREGAIRLIGRFREAGRNFNVGVLQLNAGTLARYGVSPEEALEPCLNLQIGADRLGSFYETALRRLPAGGPIAAQEAVARFLAENFRGDAFAPMSTTSLPAQPTDRSGRTGRTFGEIPFEPVEHASGAPVGPSAGAQPKVSEGDPLGPFSSPADGPNGNEAGSGPSGLIF